MSVLSPAELASKFVDVSVARTRQSIPRMLVTGLFGGVFTAFGGVIASTASHTIANVGLARLVSGLTFAFGIAFVLILGGEVFTGNTMMPMAILGRKITPVGMAKNLSFVGIGNLAGAVLVAGCCAICGQFNYSGGGLGAYTISVALSKTAMPFYAAVISGMLCSIIICAGTLGSMSASDTAGRVMVAYLSIALFVVCGFDNSVANMYYLPAGMFAAMNPAYTAKAVELGLDPALLTWGRCLSKNLLPVLLGNLLGGTGVGAFMWFCHLRTDKKATSAR